MKSDFTLAFNEILETRALSREIVLEALEQALVSAYRRDASVGSSQQRIEAEITPDGQPRILVEKEVVDSVIDERTEVLLDKARVYDPDCELGDMVMAPVEKISSNFGRIAAQTAKQVILQRIREAERETLYNEFIEREGDLITGTVQSYSSGMVTLSLGRAEAIMPRNHQMQGERYRQHEKVRVYVVEVSKSPRGPQIVVSRAHKDMLRRLLEYEVPEIYNGLVEIKNIAREAGQRSKVAVAALQEGVDPVGACVGMRGMRIQNIIKELNNEKIDVIEWDTDPARFIAKSLSPARVSGVYLDENSAEQVRTAVVVVPENELSLAIGREGQNARLAAKLTGWRIDIKSVTEAAFESMASIDEVPLAGIRDGNEELIAEVERILEKKRTNRPVMPEEYTTITSFVDLAEKRRVDALRDQHQEQLARLEAVRPLIPEQSFNLPLDILELAPDITQALRGINNVGELMVRVLADEEGLAAVLQANGAGEDALEAIQYSLDDLVIPEIAASETAEESAEEEAVEEAELEAEVAEEEQVEAVAEPEEEAQRVSEVAEEVLDDEVPPAFPVPEEEEEEDGEPQSESDMIQARRRQATMTEPEYDDFAEGDLADEFEDEDEDDGRRGKKKKKKRVQLVYDEDIGEVVAKRRRKSSRRRNEFDDFEF
jgi:N utilization substance protein A